MKGFTLLELIIVILIVGVLATVSFVHYGVYQEKSLDSEAEGNLALIVAAERVFHMENSAYYVSTDEGDLNDNLRLFLPEGAARKWAYSTVENAAVNPPVLCAQATRNDGSADPRTWSFRTTDPAPVSDSCP